MHPPLEAHKNEGCDGVIEALEECHRAGSFNRFLGTCNDAKRAVDECLKQEFLAQREANKGKSKEKRKRMEAIWKEMEEPPADLKK
ncbi:MAG: cytochrome c oxidase biogenesis protein Cmc1-like protein [Benjaminiella poitrasii]|nr:MAG: cytochrome c oxidase biogenesis protein Cmc1-like protein [Benjaminiella poitrasii]